MLKFNALALLALTGTAYAEERPASPRAMVVVEDATTKRDEPPPHGNIGMSTAYRISDAVPGRIFEFRRRILHPGAAIGGHKLAHDEVYHVLAGEGVVESDGVSRPVRAGMTAYLFDGATVGIRQAGKEPLSLIIAYPLARRAP